jgi:D-alanine--D-alanine ligase
MQAYKKKFKIALLCGGPSLERGISLNSARSVLDHLASESIEIIPIYFDQSKKAYRILPSQLYSNTPSDFDFKLKNTGVALTQDKLVALLKKEVDIVFNAIHGPFGEDGEIQAFLEKHDIPFVGSGAEACKIAFDKYIANEFIKENNFFTLPSVVLKIYNTDHKKLIDNFFKKNNIKRAIVKPATGGSSIGVFSVSDESEALEKVNLLFSKRMDTRVVIEPFAKGQEFTTIILQNRFGMPVAILPTEIETDYAENQIFDFRKKYLPTRQVTYHCPPRFSNEDHREDSSPSRATLHTSWYARLRTFRWLDSRYG